MKKINGYFTVEAALLFPLVMGVILLVIYMLFFQYDRCLMEQSAAVLALRGCTIQTTDSEKLVREVLRQSRNEDKPYLAWETREAKITMKGNSFAVECAGTLKFPFKGMMFWRGNDLWESRAIYRNQRIRPVLFIRNYRKLGGK